MSTNPSDQPVKLTKTTVDRLTPPAAGQHFLRDAALKGFGVRITAGGTCTFILEKRINGKVRRIKLGRYGELTVEQARKRAAQLLGDIAFGVDPVAEKRKAKLKAQTLTQCYQDFLKARKGLTASTLRGYSQVMRGPLKDWAEKPITGITKAMVAKRHQDLGEQRGEHYANLSMRFLRAVLNFAQATYQDPDGHSIILENPVRILSQTRAWYRTERRRTVIKKHQLPAWFEAVESLRGPDHPASATVVADYLLLVILTGLRSQEAATLQWSQIDLADRTLTLPDPKNHQPHVLPLSHFLHALLTRRQAAAVNSYVFPGKERHGSGDCGHLVEPKRQLQHVRDRSGVAFTLHDLRRTFITAADALGILPYTIKRLVNHKMNHDVTAGYVISDVEDLRRHMQRITDFFLSAGGLSAAGHHIIPSEVAGPLYE